MKLSGATVSLTETISYQTWENGNISCVAALGKHWNSECEKQLYSYISISIYEIIEKIRSCDNIEKERLKNMQNSEKKKRLKDF
jgi:hypothetical protein